MNAEDLTFAIKYLVGLPGKPDQMRLAALDCLRRVLRTMNTEEAVMNTSATPVRKGAQLPCPRCGEAIANIDMDLSDIHGDEALHCNECDGRFGAAEIRDIVARWAPVLSWMDSFPIDREDS